MKKRKLSLFIAAVVAAVTVAGCGNASNESGVTNVSEGTSSEAASQETGEKSSITVPSVAAVSNLDQTVATIDADMGAIGALSAGLYRDSEEGFILDIPEKEEISEDGLTRTYTLRETYWSDGQPVKAQDFVYSWRRLADPNSGAGYAFFLQTIGVKNAAAVISGELPVEELGVYAPDDKTFVVETDHYVPYFAEIVSFVQFDPLRQDVVEKAGDQYGLSIDSVLASGIWKPVEWQPGSESITFERNEYYYDQTATDFDKYVYQAISDPQTAYMSYQNGDLDYLSLSGDLVDLLRDTDGFTTNTAKQIHYLEPNLNNQYLSNLNIRKAIATAINKQEIADTILKNGSIPANFIVSERLGKDSAGKSFREFTGNVNYYEYNTDEALKYWEEGLKELGVTEFSIELLYDDTEAQGDIAQYLQATLQQALPGLTITLQQQPKKNRIDLMVNGNFELGLTKWGADYDDPSTFLDLFRENNSYNHSGYYSADYEAILDKAATDDLLDVDKRYQDYKEAEDLLFETLPAIPVYQDGNAFVINPELSIPIGSSGRYTTTRAKKK